MDYAIARRRMVDQQLKPRGIHDPEVLRAMRTVPRHRFVAEALEAQAYSDYPLPIGMKQTISQPFIVALMTQELQPQAMQRVLEVGTGSGYQAAVLAEIVAKVYTLERIAELAQQARRTLDDLGYSNVFCRVADGTLGWEEQAPFDGILVTAAAPDVPAMYQKQLTIGGRLLVPVGDRYSQALVRITREGEHDFRREEVCGCRFVPLLGAYGWPEDEEI